MAITASSPRVKLNIYNKYNFVIEHSMQDSMCVEIIDYTLQSISRHDDGNISLNMIVTSAAKISDEDSGNKSLCSSEYVVDLDKVFEQEICQITNCIITGNNIPIVIFNLTHFPSIKVTIDMRNHENTKITQLFDNNLRRNMQECAGKRKQTILILNESIQFIGLKMVDY